MSRRNARTDIVSAVDTLGLNIEALKAMKIVTNALNKIPDASERALRGTAIFGPRFRVMSQLAKEDIKGLRLRVWKARLRGLRRRSPGDEEGDAR